MGVGVRWIGDAKGGTRMKKRVDIVYSCFCLMKVKEERNTQDEVKRHLSGCTHNTWLLRGSIDLVCEILFIWYAYYQNTNMKLHADLSHILFPGY